MAWLSLLAAGLCAALWAPARSLCTLSAMGLSIWLPSAAMREIATAVAYSVWTAVSTLLVFAFGAPSGQQSISLQQAVSALGPIACVLGLKFG